MSGLSCQINSSHHITGNEIISYRASALPATVAVAATPAPVLQRLRSIVLAADAGVVRRAVGVVSYCMLVGPHLDRCLPVLLVGVAEAVAEALVVALLGLVDAVGPSKLNTAPSLVVVEAVVQTIRFALATAEDLRSWAPALRRSDDCCRGGENSEEGVLHLCVAGGVVVVVEWLLELMMLSVSMSLLMNGSYLPASKQVYIPTISRQDRTVDARPFDDTGHAVALAFANSNFKIIFPVFRD